MTAIYGRFVEARQYFEAVQWLKAIDRERQPIFGQQSRWDWFSKMEVLYDAAKLPVKHDGAFYSMLQRDAGKVERVLGLWIKELLELVKRNQSLLALINLYFNGCWPTPMVLWSLSEVEVRIIVQELIALITKEDRSLLGTPARAIQIETMPPDRALMVHLLKGLSKFVHRDFEYAEDEDFPSRLIAAGGVMLVDSSDDSDYFVQANKRASAWNADFNVLGQTGFADKMTSLLTFRIDYEPVVPHARWLPLRIPTAGMTELVKRHLVTQELIKGEHPPPDTEYEFPRVQTIPLQSQYQPLILYKYELMGQQYLA